ncbi:MAG: lipopolysaccharide heptosyltransferase [Chthonomonadaceae bacterium]|nr:lipopolysaccharide heptosyltransferase [Chthonomonadaceae bacterium]
MSTPILDLNRVERLLIIRLSSIGDVTHALPLSAALHEAFPNLEITWIVEEMSAEIVLGNPTLHEVIVVPRSRWKQGRWRSPQVWREYFAFMKALRARNFDVTLDLQGYAKSAFMALATGAKHRFGWWRLRDGANLVSRSLPRRPQSLHRVDWFLDVGRALGADPQRVTFPLHVPEEARRKVHGLLIAGGIDPTKPYAVVNPAVGDQTRRWGAQKYAELVQGLAVWFHLPAVLIGSSKDAVICEEVRTLALRDLPIQAEGRTLATDVSVWPNEMPPPVSLAGQTSLKELAAVLEGCAVHICGDTGSAHIAAALERPVVAVYGPTDPAMAGPWGQSDHVISHRKQCHATCSVKQCFYTRGGGGFQGETIARCLAFLSPTEVLQKVESVLHE